MKRSIVLASLLAFAAAAAFAAHPDLILTDGTIFTGRDPAFVQAVAITGDRITAVGTNDEISALAGPSTIGIKLQRHLVIPGINDAHVHFQTLPPNFFIDASNSSFADLTDAIGNAVMETPADFWIFATIGPTIFLDPAVNRQALDAVARGRKIMLTELTGHGAILNTPGMAALGVSVPINPKGGLFERDAQGQPTGRAFEYAEYGLLRKLADSSSDDDDVEGFRNLCSQALALGITTMQVMPWMAARHFESIVAAAHSDVRVRVMRIPVPASTDMNFGDNRGGGIRAVKWLLDGTPVERGAATRKHYSGSNDSGTINFTPQQLLDILADAVRFKEQPVLHVAGDRTAEFVLRAMKAMALPDWPSKHLRMEHGDGLQRDLIPDAVAMGVIVVQNPTHFSARNLYPPGDYMLLKTLLKSGVHLALGSDGPPLNPFLDISLAVTHPQVPDEKLTVAEALTAYTAGSAYAEEKEHAKGAIAPGQLADLAVLSADLFKIRPEAMPATVSVLTIVGGKIAYDAGVLH